MLAEKPSDRGTSPSRLTGYFLLSRLQALRDAGLHRITVSLDTLRPPNIPGFDRAGCPCTEWSKALKPFGRPGFANVKLDTVVVKGVNDEELGDPIAMPPARPGSRWSHPRPGPSSTPWLASSRAGTGRRRVARARDRGGAGPGPRRARQRDLPGPGSQPGTASRPVLVPLRCRLDGPANRFAAVRRGAPRGDRLEGLGASRDGGLRRGGRPPGVPLRQGGHAHRPCRAGRHWSGGHPIGVAPLPGSERVYEPLRASMGNARHPQRTQLLARRRRLARRGQARPLRAPARGGDRPGLATWPTPRTSIASGASGPFPCCRSEARRWEGDFPIRPRRPTSIPGNGPMPSAGPCWPSGSCRACGFRMPTATWRTSPRRGSAALAGKDPEAALREAGRCLDRSHQVAGHSERQLWHYRRSLNSLTTLPQPPPRGK